MKGKLIAFAGILCTASLIVSALSSVAQAQQSCPVIRAIIHATLPTSYPLAPDTDVWGGPVFATIGGEFLLGGVSGSDGVGTRHGSREGRYQVYLCDPTVPGVLIYPSVCLDSITYEVPNSVFGFVPGKVGLGAYRGNTARIVSGTGRFEGAFGNLNVAGAYILWPDEASPWGIYGRWNGELSGSICGVD